MLTKEFVLDTITVTETGNLEIRKVLRVLEDGLEIGRRYSRYVIEPGQPYAGEDPKVIAIANIIHTPQVIAQANTRLANQERP
jgi:hypothetical protein